MNHNIIKKHGLSIVFLITLIALAACTTANEVESTPVAARVELTISGSGSTMAVLDGLQAQFEAETPGYHLILLPGTGTGGGVEGTVSGVLDVAAMSRLPKDAEVEQGILFSSFGLAATAVFTHVDVGVADLSSSQMAAIFSGEITNWSEVGGPDELIVLFVRDEADSSTAALREIVMGDVPFAESAQVLTSAEAMLQAVEGTQNSVGFGTWPAAAAAGINVAAVSLDGISPNVATYPMTNEMGLGFLAEDRANVQPLIDWLGSESGQAVLDSFDMILTR